MERMLFILCVMAIRIQAIDFQVTASQEYGELDGRSQLRCTIRPKNIDIKSITWQLDEQNVLCIYTPQIDQRQFCKDYQMRRVESNFHSTDFYHKLQWENSRFSDEERYTCLVKTSHGESAADQIDLKLVLPMKDPPEILDKYDFVISSKLCQTPTCAPEVKLFGETKQQFTCRAGPARPKPTVMWSFADERLHGHPDEYEVRRSGGKVFIVNNTIQLSHSKAPLLICYAEAFTPNSPQSPKKELKEAFVNLNAGKINYIAKPLKEYVVLQSGRPKPLGCEVTPKDASVVEIVWKSREGNVFEYNNINKSSRPVGKFSGRNIVGFFNKRRLEHALWILDGKPDDGVTYSCIFKIEHTYAVEAEVSVVYVETPRPAPSIYDDNGISISASQCNDNIKRVTTTSTFVCVANGSFPQPKISWIYHGDSDTDPSIVETLMVNGHVLYNVQNSITVRNVIGNIALKCRIDLQHDKLGTLHTICMSVQLSGLSGCTPWSSMVKTVVVLLAIANFITIIVIMLILWNKYGSRSTDTNRNRNTNSTSPNIDHSTTLPLMRQTGSANQEGNCPREKTQGNDPMPQRPS